MRLSRKILNTNTYIQWIWKTLGGKWKNKKRITIIWLQYVHPLITGDASVFNMTQPHFISCSSIYHTAEINKIIFWLTPNKMQLFFCMIFFTFSRFHPDCWSHVPQRKKRNVFDIIMWYHYDITRALKWIHLHYIYIYIFRNKLVWILKVWIT